MFYHPQGWQMWMPDSSPSNNQDHFRVLVIVYLSVEVLVTSFEFLQGYVITIFVAVPVPVSVSVWWEAPPLQAGALSCHHWLWGARYATRQLSCSNTVSLCHEEEFPFPPVPYEWNFQTFAVNLSVSVFSSTDCSLYLVYLPFSHFLKQFLFIDQMIQ